MIKYSLTKLSWVGWENIWLSVIAYGLAIIVSRVSTDSV